MMMMGKKGGRMMGMMMGKKMGGMEKGKERDDDENDDNDDDEAGNDRTRNFLDEYIGHHHPQSEHNKELHVEIMDSLPEYEP